MYIRTKVLTHYVPVNKSFTAKEIELIINNDGKLHSLLAPKNSNVFYSCGTFYETVKPVLNPLLVLFATVGTIFLAVNYFEKKSNKNARNKDADDNADLPPPYSSDYEDGDRPPAYSPDYAPEPSAPPSYYADGTNYVSSFAPVVNHYYDNSYKNYGGNHNVAPSAAPKVSTTNTVEQLMKLSSEQFQETYTAREIVAFMNIYYSSNAQNNPELYYTDLSLELLRHAYKDADVPTTDSIGFFDTPIAALDLSYPELYS